MTWYAFKPWAGNSYGPIDVAGIQEKNLTVWGFHGYATMAQAIQHPNAVNFSNAFVVALAEKDYQTAVNSGEQPGGPNATLTPGNVAKGAVQNAIHGLTQGWELWVLRIGEIILGVVLIGVGVAKLTGTDNIIMKAATTAGKAAIL